jgi:outer membrane protein OmpA-like peptidoglycan-associated protein
MFKIKLSLITSSLAAIMLSNAAYADLNLWIGADMGAATGWVSDDYQAQANLSDVSSVKPTIDSIGDTRFAWTVSAGMDISPLFLSKESSVLISSQLEWFDMGAVDLKFSGLVTDAEREAFNNKMEKIHPKSGQGVALSLITRVSPLSSLPQWALGGRLGGSYWSQTYELQYEDTLARTESTSGVGVLGALHTTYSFSDAILGKAEYKVQQFDQEYSQAATIGLEYRFNDVFNSADGRDANDVSAPISRSTVVLPVAQSDDFLVEQGQSVSLDVLLNDRSTNTKALFISKIEQGNEGVAEIVDGQRIQYQHIGGIQLTDQLQYWVSNGEQEVGPINVNLGLTNLDQVEFPSEFEINVLFSPDMEDIKPSYLSMLDQYAQALLLNDTVHVIIEGHTDNFGEQTFNQTLSTSRAQTVADYLISKGVEASRLSVTGLSDQNPIADNATAQGRDQNRRVVVINKLHK